MAAPLRPEEVPDDLVCPICLSIPLDPCLLKNCSHVFCKDCIWKSLTQKSRCPVCRCASNAEGDVMYLRTKNPLSYRIWSKIAVKCEHQAEGCAWTGSVSDYRSHKQSCPQIEKTRQQIDAPTKEGTQLKTNNEDAEQKILSLKVENLQIPSLKEKIQRLKSENKLQKKQLRLLQSGLLALENNKRGKIKWWLKNAAQYGREEILDEIKSVTEKAFV